MAKTVRARNNRTPDWDRMTTTFLDGVRNFLGGTQRNATRAVREAHRGTGAKTVGPRRNKSGKRR